MKKEQETKREQEAGIGDFGGALIVRDPSLKLNEQWELPEFVRWLREERFRQAFYKGWFDRVDWVFINIKAEKYQPGMPGIKVCRVIYEHAITIDEFKFIYSMVNKYEGLDLLQMEKESK